MTACAWKFSALLALLPLAAATSGAIAAPRSTVEAEATLVVYNRVNPDSRGLAEYYAAGRGIPPSQVVGLDCPDVEEISREDYDKTIAGPLRKLFEERGWWRTGTGTDGKKTVSESSIRFVALMRGMPLKIKTIIQPPAPDKPAPPRPNGGDPVRGHDEASVDSELSVVGSFIEESFSVINNPYFRRFTPILESETSPGLLLVCRLDAPDAATVRRMIDDSLHAERNGLYGWAYIDRRSIPEGNYREGDEWLQAAAAECWRQGLPVVLDNMPAVFPAGFPVTNAALYYGWYEWNISGALAAPDLQFSRGAIAVHIQSFSASTLRNPAASWAGPLVFRGAAATLGNVYEPYLGLTAQLDTFNDRLLKGFTLAESAYMSQRVLSWMSVVVGDPLYRPFGDISAEWRRETTPETKPWITLGETLRRASREGVVQNLYLGRLARESRTGLNYEALGLLQSFSDLPRPALESLETAGDLYKSPAEIFRTTIERVRILQSLGDKTAALKLIDRTAQRPQPPERAKLLQAIRDEIAPPPPSPSPTPKP